MNDDAIDRLVEVIELKHQSMGKLLADLKVSLAVRKAHGLPITGVYRSEVVGSPATGFIKIIYDEDDNVIVEARTR